MRRSHLRSGHHAPALERQCAFMKYLEFFCMGNSCFLPFTYWLVIYIGMASGVLFYIHYIFCSNCYSFDHWETLGSCLLYLFDIFPSL